MVACLYHIPDLKALKLNTPAYLPMGIPRMRGVQEKGAQLQAASEEVP